VPRDEPAWWYGDHSQLPAVFLQPFAAIWGAVASRRLRTPAIYTSSCPVICVGNFTAGGTGKTPLSRLMAHLIRSRGFTPIFLTRGYGGRRTGPHWVDQASDSARDVGDEPLLLARDAPVMLARDRAEGARAIDKIGNRLHVIIMDDGLQNPALTKDLTIAVVDGRRGVGNGRVIPAGPLRAPLQSQLQRVDAIVINTPAQSTPDPTIVSRMKTAFDGSLLTATTTAVGQIGWLRDRPVLAFAGIGAPERFFNLLTSLGARVAHTRSFPDHHEITDAEATELLRLAETEGWQLVTTEKDQARLTRADGGAGDLRDASRALAVACQLGGDDHERLERLVEKALKSRRRP
jgi:tetraacyldisaccharide 4'-kinase